MEPLNNVVDLCEVRGGGGGGGGEMERCWSHS